ncbi:hypothetical protein ASL14_19250 [Paenibacillus sp. IHB B 3084]|uniref:hypothetical protein n=1 Tax=Paenibacillus sp. IHB B 3084 TaxID=867076 RepID=UPI00072012BD|nr:hypothetical protein [Paenibacillus sp. IHB B 3084]ALP38008.1 hypothetical protein ASL14_19250 [Paenibacillus sp. IHB B 3084]
MKEVQQMKESELNISLEVLLGAKEDRHRKGNILKGTYSLSPRDYATNPGDSLEIQESAIKVDAKLYIKNLVIVKWGEEVYYQEFSIFEVIDLKGIAILLNASPRERAMAVYLTLKEIYLSL